MNHIDETTASTENVRPVSMPMAASVQLRKLNNPTVDVRHYQSMLGSLMYAAVGTLPDFSFAASAPGEQHLHALKQIFQYLIMVVRTIVLLSDL